MEILKGKPNLQVDFQHESENLNEYELPILSYYKSRLYIFENLK